MHEITRVSSGSRLVSSSIILAKKASTEGEGQAIWQYGLWSFQTGYTKLERFLHKNQHTQRILLNFENWTKAASK